MDVLADLLVYSVGGFVLKRAITYLQDRALLNKRDLEEVLGEHASRIMLPAGGVACYFCYLMGIQTPACASSSWLCCAGGV